MVKKVSTSTIFHLNVFRDFIKGVVNPLQKNDSLSFTLGANFGKRKPLLPNKRVKNRHKRRWKTASPMNFSETLKRAGNTT